MDKLSRKGFLGVFAGLFAAPAVAMAMPEKPTGGYLIPPGNEDFIESIRNFRNFEGMAPSMDDFSHWELQRREIDKYITGVRNGKKYTVGYIGTLWITICSYHAPEFCHVMANRLERRVKYRAIAFDLAHMPIDMRAITWAEIRSGQIHLSLER